MLRFTVSIMFLFLSPRFTVLPRRHHVVALSTISGAANNNNNNLIAISSTKSATVKKIQALLTKRKKRIEYGQTVVEGPRMVTDLYQNHKTRHLVQQIIVSTDKWETYSKQLFEFDRDDATTGMLLLAATPEVFKVCTDTVTSQGILAICDIPQYSIPADNDDDDDDDNPTTRFFLVLDDLQDPGNLGTLLRSSVATGVTGVYLLPGCCDPWNPKAVRSAVAATFQVPILPTTSWEDCKQQLDEAGCKQIWAATMLHDGGDNNNKDSQQENNNEGTLCHFSVDWVSEPSALVIGNEGNGLTPALRQALHANQRIQAVHVPMQPGVESLNAGVCGSVILFEYYRQWQLQKKSI